METLTLVEFLTARLDDDAAYARNAYGEHNDNGPDWTEIWSGAVELGGTGQELVVTNDSPVSRHIARHNPARVLREVEAKRRIVKHAETAHERAKVGPSEGDGAWFLVLRYLALPYDDHPDYREEWRP